jgi:ribonucleoside-diphosphate reductase alpha chain
MQEQSEAIGRLISLSLRAGVKIHEIINQLKGIRGPMPTITSRGTILSLPDAIGRILQDHVQNATSPTGNDFREAEHTSSSVAPLSSTGVTIDEMLSRETGAEAAPETKRSIASYGYMPGCPDCGESLHMSEGCMSCSNCGFSRCM